MGKKRKNTSLTPKPETVKPRNVIAVPCRNGESLDDATARTLLRPSVNAAATIQTMQGDNHEINALAREISAQIAAVNGGDLKRAEGMLIAQAHTLDEIFNSLARRACRNMREYLDAAERYMRLALKAQSQCRATLETLAAVKNPPVLFAKQANIAAGPQQVNNGVPAGDVSRAREIENPSNQLLEAKHGERLDFGTQGAAGTFDKPMEAVGAVNRTEDGGR